MVGLPHSSEFNRTCDAALNMIGARLRDVYSQFRTTDFPRGGAVEFRNRLLLYPDCFLAAARHYIYAEPNDVWAVANAAITASMAPPSLYKIVGYCHLFCETRPFNRMRANSKPHQVGAWFVPSLKVTLDWVTNIYGQEDEVAKEWFHLTIKQLDHGQWLTDAEKLMSSQISRVVGRDPDVLDTTWMGFALTVDVLRSNETSDEQKANWAMRCQQYFGD